MAEPERTTSFAKSVEGLHQEEKALDRVPSLRGAFVPAQEQNNEKQKPRETVRQGESEKSGSQMIRQDAPLMRPSPNGNLRQGPDRFAAYRKLEQEHKKAGSAPKDRMLRQNLQEANKPAEKAAAPPAKQDPGIEAAKRAAAEKALQRFNERQGEIERQMARDRSRDRER